MKAVTLSSRYWMDMVASHGNVFLSAWECIYPGDEALSGGRWPFLENLMKKETGTWNTRFPDVRA